MVVLYCYLGFFSATCFLYSRRCYLFIVFVVSVLFWCSEVGMVQLWIFLSTFIICRRWQFNKTFFVVLTGFLRRITFSFHFRSRVKSPLPLFLSSLDCRSRLSSCGVPRFRVFRLFMRALFVSGRVALVTSKNDEAVTSTKKGERPSFEPPTSSTI